jgi:hypothetical protein
MRQYHSPQNNGWIVSVHFLAHGGNEGIKTYSLFKADLDKKIPCLRMKGHINHRAL